MAVRRKRQNFIRRNGKKLHGAAMNAVLRSENARRRKNGPKRRRNVEYGYTVGGVFHPIRASVDYDPRRAGEGKPAKKAKKKPAKKAAAKRRVAAKRPAAKASRSAVASKRRMPARKAAPGRRRNARRMTSTRPFKAVLGASPAGPFVSSLGLTNPRKRRNGMLLGINPRKRSRRRNPEDGIFEQFHGRESDGFKVGLAPDGTPKHTEYLGKLICLYFKNGSSGEIQFGKGDHDHPDLVSNRTGTRVYVVGDIPCSDQRNHFVGYLTKLDYRAIKDHIDGGIKTLYFHKLGEETGVLPELWTDHDGYLVIKDGDYYITEDGIIN